MKKIIACLFIVLVACHQKSTDQKFADQQYEQFKKDLQTDSLNPLASSAAEYIALYDYDEQRRKEAATWLKQYNAYMQSIRSKDSIEKAGKEQKFKQLGGVTELEKDFNTKCNLYRAYYLLNKKITDSADLSFMSLYMAEHLFQNGTKNPGCIYPIMSDALLYLTEKDFRIGRSVASCTITPSNYAGEIFINSNLLSELK